jgi:hypothetical protein
MKLTEEIKVRLDEQTAEAFRRRAHAAGCNPGELLRDIVVHLEHGVTWGEHIANVRRLAVTREGPIAGRLHVFPSPAGGTAEDSQLQRGRA